MKLRSLRHARDRLHRARSEFQLLRRFVPGYLTLLRRMKDTDPELLRDVVKGISGENDALARLGTRFAAIRLATEVASTRDAAKGFAKSLLDDDGIGASLRAVPHLGALQPLLAVPATRLDYASFTLAAIVELKKAHAGRGLGAPSRLVPGKMTRLVLAQCWAVLFNYGHLFGTFSTERMVLYELHHDGPMRRRFYGQVDQTVRKSVGELVDRQDLDRFHVALAAWRISRWPAGKMRKTALQCICAYFESPSDAPERWLHRSGRRLAYNRLQSITDVAGEFVKTSHQHDLARTRLWPRVLSPDGGRLQSVRDPTTELFDALDRYHHEVIFASPRAASLVLTHLRGFRSWHKTQDTEGATDWIAELFTQPQDWPSAPAATKREHVGRISYQSTSPWVQEVDHWLGVHNESWTRGNFVLTPVQPPQPGGPVRLNVDIYAPEARLSQDEAVHVLRVAERWKHSLSTDSYLDVSVANLVTTLLEQCFEPGFSILLRPVMIDGQHRFCTMGAREEVAPQLRHSAAACGEDNRREELIRLSIAAEKEENGGLMIALLAQARVRRPEDRDEHTDLDGVLLMIDTSESWLVLEAKTGSGTGHAQLLSLKSVLVVPASEPDLDTVPGSSCIHFCGPSRDVT